MGGIMASVSVFEGKSLLQAMNKTYLQALGVLIHPSTRLSSAARKFGLPLQSL